MDEKQTDGLSALADALAIRRSGWHRVENPESGAIAYFPVTANDVEEWEQRALAQARESERLGASTQPDAKPLQNSLQERVNILRGD